MNREQETAMYDQPDDEGDEMKYGPQTPEIEALLARVRTLTATEARELGAAWYAVSGSARHVAWHVAWSSAWWGVELDASYAAAYDAALDAVPEEAWYWSRGAVRDAVFALIARDSITPAGFTQEHYDLLTGPWASVIGKVHPDDGELVVSMSELTGKRLEIALAISEVTTMTVEEADRMAEKMVRGLDRFAGLSIGMTPEQEG